MTKAKNAPDTQVVNCSAESLPEGVLAPGRTGVCPHCQKEVQFLGDPKFWRCQIASTETILEGPNASLNVLLYPKRAAMLHIVHCAGCSGLVIDLVWTLTTNFMRERTSSRALEVERLYPKKYARTPPPLAVPEELRADYLEAAGVANVSERGAAVILRYCLQRALRAKGFSAKSEKLFDEIEVASKHPDASSMLRTKLHLLREVGNYGAHPNGDGSGGVMQVEPGEVDALFDALDNFFDDFFVKPAKHAENLATINAKLLAAGKKPIKGT